MPSADPFSRRRGRRPQEGHRSSPIAPGFAHFGSGLTVTHIGTLFGETSTIVGLTTVTVIVFRLVFHRWRESVLLAIVVIGQPLIFLPTTSPIARPRPPVQQIDVSPPTSSFPSGHTAAA